LLNHEGHEEHEVERVSSFHWVFFFVLFVVNYDGSRYWDFSMTLRDAARWLCGDFLENTTVRIRVRLLSFGF